MLHHDQTESAQKSFDKDVSSLVSVFEELGRPDLFLGGTTDIFVLDTKKIASWLAVASFEPTIGGGLTLPSSYSTATSLRLLSPGYVMCDMPKNVSIELTALLLYRQKKNIANSYCYRNG